MQYTYDERPRKGGWGRSGEGAGDAERETGQAACTIQVGGEAKKEVGAKSARGDREIWSDSAIDVWMSM